MTFVIEHPIKLGTSDIFAMKLNIGNIILDPPYQTLLEYYHDLVANRTLLASKRLRSFFLGGEPLVNMSRPDSSGLVTAWKYKLMGHRKQVLRGDFYLAEADAMLSRMLSTIAATIQISDVSASFILEQVAQEVADGIYDVFLFEK